MHDPLPPGLVPGGRFDDWRRTPVRYVVCDVDGTLVGPQDLATDEVALAVERARTAGVSVGYATGRMRRGVAALHDQLRAGGPHILHNGAEVRADGRTIAAWSLAPPQVDALLALARERDDLYAEVYTDGGFHVSSWDERARDHWDLLASDPIGVLANAADLHDEAVLKVTFAVFEPQGGAWLLERLSHVDVEVGAAGSPRTPHLTYVNVNRPGTDKGVALRRAAQHLGVPLTQVAAIGDATNDVPMLDLAGTAIAMGQADAAVRSRAHLVVPDVDAHGVAVALDALTGWLDHA